MHHDFVAFLEEQFAGYYLPKSYGWTSTLNTIWSSGKRLVLGYDEKRVVSRYESVWPCVTHQWGNVRTIEDLFNYLNRIETESIGYVLSSGARADDEFKNLPALLRVLSDKFFQAFINSRSTQKRKDNDRFLFLFFF